MSNFMRILGEELGSNPLQKDWDQIFLVKCLFFWLERWNKKDILSIKRNSVLELGQGEDQWELVNIESSGTVCYCVGEVNFQIFWLTKSFCIIVRMLTKMHQCTENEPIMSTEKVNHEGLYRYKTNTLNAELYFVGKSFTLQFWLVSKWLLRQNRTQRWHGLETQYGLVVIVGLLPRNST